MSKLLSVRFSDDVFEYYQGVAAKSERSFAWVINRVLKESMGAENPSPLPLPPNGFSPPPYIHNIYTPPLPLPPTLTPLPNNFDQIGKRGRGSAKPDPEGFGEFWLQYPRKVGKGAARKAWLKAAAKASAGEILAGLARVEWPADADYIPHPSTWLNQERWADETPDNTLAAKLGRIVGVMGGGYDD